MSHEPDFTSTDPRGAELAAEAARRHAARTGAAPRATASAPGTFPVLGEAADYYGGAVVVATAALRAGLAVSPRGDGTVTVEYTGPEGTFTDATDFETLEKLAAEQEPEIDEEGHEIEPPAPSGGLAVRFGGVAWTLLHRQQIPRETSGLDVTVCTDIPADAGLGALSAADVALALALHSLDAQAVDDVPGRAKLAEACTQGVAMFSEVPAMRARHTVALRGRADSLTVIDYSDGSAAPVVSPFGRGLTAVVVADHAGAPVRRDKGVPVVRARRRFLDHATHAFGTDSLRRLPDANARTADWLDAVHEVHGAEGTPETDEVREWLGFWERETARALRLGAALRSRHVDDALELLAESDLDQASRYSAAPDPGKVSAAARSAGARVARACCLATDEAALAVLPAEGDAALSVKDFTAKLTEAAAGSPLVVELGSGSPAALEGEAAGEQAAGK